MTGQQPEIQWYIAREGKQHGPLSDPEMRTFIAQGHLKPTDLIWRPGFDDWRPAPAVFSLKGPEPTSQPPPASRQTEPREPGHAPPQSPERSFEPDLIQTTTDSPEHEPRRRLRVLGAAFVVLLLVGAGGWYYMSQPGTPGAESIEIVRADPKNGTADNEPQTGISETTTAAIAPAETSPGTSAPLVSTVSPEVIEKNAQELDEKLQLIGLWGLVKREFPDWYGERISEAAKLSAENQPQGAITKHMAEALVALRRKHANQALAASTEKLKNVATAFLANLKNLSERSEATCFSFISNGETAPGLLELWQSPEQGATVHAQMAAIFEAIAEGRQAPTTHEPAVKRDYEVLVKQLAKLGWKENDLQVFSNPKALAKQPPSRVCKMVQDWFVAHLAVEDQSTQERLLVETLKPVVSG